MPGKRLCSIMAIVASILLFSPQAEAYAKAAETRPAARRVEGASPIKVAAIAFNLPLGREIGHHHSSLLKLKHDPYIWDFNMQKHSEAFSATMITLLKERGYTVVNDNGLFSGRRDTAQAAYELGGVVNDITFNTYGYEKTTFETALSIEWQVFDTLKKQVVFSLPAKGHAKHKKSAAACFGEAFNKALEVLLADEKFVATVTTDPAKDWQAQPGLLSPLVISPCPENQPPRLPQDTEAILAAVIIIRNGGATGSGVIISPDGWAMTAAHVVTGAQTVTVVLKSGIELAAEVIRTDTPQDAALIRLPGRGFPCMKRSLEPPALGSEIFAIGAPLGEELSFSVTRGIVSGWREKDGVKLLQTDAALNPGNSGGPLVSADGRLAAIVSSKIASLGVEGLAFGVPVEALAARLNIDWK